VSKRADGSTRQRRVTDQPAIFEPLEPRVLLSASTLGAGAPSFIFNDADGDRVAVYFAGPGQAEITLDADAQDNADIDSIELTGTTDATRLTLRVTPAFATPSDQQTTIDTIHGDGSMNAIILTHGVVDGQGIRLDGSLNMLNAEAMTQGADLTLGQAANFGTRVMLNTLQGTDADASILTTPGSFTYIMLRDGASDAELTAGQDMRTINSLAGLSDTTIQSGGSINAVLVRGAVENVNIQSDTDLNILRVLGETNQLQLDVDGQMRSALLRGNATDVSITADTLTGSFRVLGDADGVDMDFTGSAGLMFFQGNANDVDIDIAGDGRGLRVFGDADQVTMNVGDRLGVLFFRQDTHDIMVDAAGDLSRAMFLGDASDVNLSVGADVNNIRFGAGAAAVDIDVLGEAGPIQIMGQAGDVDIDIAGDGRGLRLFDDATNVTYAAGGDVPIVYLRGAADNVALDIAGGLNAAHFFGDAENVTLTLGDDTRALFFRGQTSNITIDAAGDVLRAYFQHGASDVTLTGDGELRNLFSFGDTTGLDVHLAGGINYLMVAGRHGMDGHLTDSNIAAGSAIDRARIMGDLTDTIIAGGGDTRLFYVGGQMHNATMLAGAVLDGSYDLTTADYSAATVHSVMVRGRMLDSIIAAGGDPGDDGLFEDGEVIDGSSIRRLRIGGQIIGANSPHHNPGIYSASLDWIHVNGQSFRNEVHAAAFAVGTAVIDPLPMPANALAVTDIEDMIERAVARAAQLGVNATISIVDREGNILGVVRMADGALTPAETTVDISAGGRGGLEAVDGLIPTSLISTTKAGTAAFLSTSLGNSFTTRTAGQIIQQHFPPGVNLQDGGPLFGVQLSSLPTSDVNRLPLGLSADPGGLPLYRGGELIGGIGVEVDGVYSLDTSGVGGDTTVEEEIALAGQIGFTEPAALRADRIFVDGLRLDFANGRAPALVSLGPLPDYATIVGGGTLTELLAPRTSPTGATGRSSDFHITALDTGIAGEVPDGSRAPDMIGYDFFDEAGAGLDFLAGDVNGAEQLTAADVELIIEQAHALNRRLRAMIRAGGNQQSQVTVSVVDHNGNLLGSFRTLDAPVFGYDVSVQKARTAAYFSRPDAGAELTALDTELAAAIATLQGIVDTDGDSAIDPSVSDPYDRHVDAAAAIGVGLDGSVAVADRTGGFLSRPNLPDGIDGAAPGPFSALPPDQFSPFNTGLQTVLILPNLASFLTTFAGVGDEAMALSMFADGTLGGPTSGVANDDNGTGLPASSLSNGMQIFAGSVPLYKNGELVGAIGVSGDGIEQDDYIALSGAAGFQEFGPGVTRADNVTIAGGIRLPYVKLPRSPFAGL